MKKEKANFIWEDRDIVQNYYHLFKKLKKIIYSPWIKIIKKEILKLKKENIILCDIGCGPGIFTLMLFNELKKNTIEKLLFVDYSKEMLKIAEKLIKNENRDLNYKLINSNAIEIKELQMSSVDIIISLHFIHEINKVEKFIKECKRILKPNGVLFLIDFDKKISIFKGKIIKLLIWVLTKNKKYSINFWHSFQKRKDSSYIINILKEKDFKIEKFFIKNIDFFIKASLNK